MKKLLFFVIFSLLALPLGTAPSLETNSARQEAQVITGRVFLGMFRSMSGDASDKALDIIGKIYGPKINKGVVPDRETLGGLARLLADYLTAHPEKMDEPMEKLVIEALKDAPVQIEAQKIFWEKAYRAARVYFAAPFAENAKKLIVALPDKRQPPLDFKGEDRLIHFIYDSSGPDQENNLSVLGKEMEAGDPYAVDIGFRLINIADGAFGEDLDYYLGAIIPKHPRLFLEKLQANQRKTEPPVLDLLDGILHPVEWWEVPKDDPDQVKYLELLNTRLDIRIEALKTVEEPHLKDIRDRCISILENMRNEKLE